MAVGALIPIIASLASAGGQFAASKASEQPAGASGFDLSQLPQTREAQALQNIFARAVALNFAQRPPTFQDFLSSGGNVQFPFVNPGLRPLEAQDLGIVSNVGGPVPVSTEPEKLLAEGLTPEQKVFLGGEEVRRAGEEHRMRQGKEPFVGPFGRLKRSEGRVNKLEKDLERLKSGKLPKFTFRDKKLAKTLGIGGDQNTIRKTLRNAPPEVRKKFIKKAKKNIRLELKEKRSRRDALLRKVGLMEEPENA